MYYLKEYFKNLEKKSKAVSRKHSDGDKKVTKTTFIVLTLKCKYFNGIMYIVHDTVNINISSLSPAIFFVEFFPQFLDMLVP